MHITGYPLKVDGADSKYFMYTDAQGEVVKINDDNNTALVKAMGQAGSVVTWKGKLVGIYSHIDLDDD